MDQVLGRLKGLTKNNDLAIAVLLLLILAVMIIPINPFFLDLLLAFTLSVSVIILLISIYTERHFRFFNFSIFTACYNVISFIT